MTFTLLIKIDPLVKLPEMFTTMRIIDEEPLVMLPNEKVLLPKLGDGVADTNELFSW